MATDTERVLAAMPNALMHVVNCAVDGVPTREGSVIDDREACLVQAVDMCSEAAVNGSIQNVWAFLAEYSQAALESYRGQIDGVVK